MNPREYLGKFWIDALVHDPAMLQLVVDQMGPSRVAMGTDYPFPLGELQPGQLINSMPYDDKVKEQLLSGAALEWLGMQRSLDLTSPSTPQVVEVVAVRCKGVRNEKRSVQ